MYRIIKEDCIKCGACVEDCPMDCIIQTGVGEEYTIVEDLCVGCGICDVMCPVEAIIEMF